MPFGRHLSVKTLKETIRNYSVIRQYAPYVDMVRCTFKIEVIIMSQKILHKYQVESTKALIQEMGEEAAKLSSFLNGIEELCLLHSKFFDSRTGENSHSHAIKFGNYVPGSRGDWAFSIELSPTGWFVTMPCNGRNGVSDEMFTKSAIPNIVNSTNHTKVESEFYDRVLVWIDEGLKSGVLSSNSGRLPFFPANNPKSINA